MENIAAAPFPSPYHLPDVKGQEEEGRIAVLGAAASVLAEQSPEEANRRGGGGGAAAAAAALPIAGAKKDARSTPPLYSKKGKTDMRRITPPNLVKPVTVPPKKIFGVPDRYMSPTDSMMSPVSRGLLARSKRSLRPPPAFVPPKALENTFQEVEPAISNAS